MTTPSRPPFCFWVCLVCVCVPMPLVQPLHHFKISRCNQRRRHFDSDPKKEKQLSLLSAKLKPVAASYCLICQHHFSSIEAAPHQYWQAFFIFLFFCFLLSFSLRWAPRWKNERDLEEILRAGRNANAASAKGISSDGASGAGGSTKQILFTSSSSPVLLDITLPFFVSPFPPSAANPLCRHSSCYPPHPPHRRISKNDSA